MFKGNVEESGNRLWNLHTVLSVLKRRDANIFKREKCASLPPTPLWYLLKIKPAVVLNIDWSEIYPMQSLSHLVRTDSVEGSVRGGSRAGGRAEAAEGWANDKEERPGLSELGRKARKASSEGKEAGWVLGTRWASPKESEMHSRDPVEISHQRGPAVIVTLSRAENRGNRARQARAWACAVI